MEGAWKWLILFKVTWNPGGPGCPCSPLSPAGPCDRQVISDTQKIRWRRVGSASDTHSRARRSSRTSLTIFSGQALFRKFTLSGWLIDSWSSEDVSEELCSLSDPDDPIDLSLQTFQVRPVEKRLMWLRNSTHNLNGRSSKNSHWLLWVQGIPSLLAVHGPPEDQVAPGDRHHQQDPVRAAQNLRH